MIVILPTTCDHPNSPPEISKGFFFQAKIKLFDVELTLSL